MLYASHSNSKLVSHSNISFSLVLISAFQCVHLILSYIIHYRTTYRHPLWNASAAHTKKHMISIFPQTLDTDERERIKSTLRRKWEQTEGRKNASVMIMWKPKAFSQNDKYIKYFRMTHRENEEKMFEGVIVLVVGVRRRWGYIMYQIVMSMCCLYLCRRCLLVRESFPEKKKKQSSSMGSLLSLSCFWYYVPRVYT